MEMIGTLGMVFCLVMVCLLLILMFCGMLPRRGKKRPESPETKWEKPENGQPEEIKPEKYTPIYEYVRTRGFIRCPECDGENDTAALHCCICGSRLRGAGR